MRIPSFPQFKYVALTRHSLLADVGGYSGQQQWPWRGVRSPKSPRSHMLPAVTIFAAKLVKDAILRASRAVPADAALREVLRSQRNLSPPFAAEASRLLFLYYRWLGWARDKQSLDATLQLAEHLALQFAANPDLISLEELRTKAIPPWIVKQMEVNEEWLRSLQEDPPLWLRAKRGRAKILTAKLVAARQCMLPDAILYEGSANLFKLPEFQAGEFEIQDIASQAVGLLCDPQPGETWWDACAGEGGKTLHLSDLMQNKGLIWASDRLAWRLARLKRRAARAQAFNYRAVSWDGSAKLPTKSRFDGVLVDAPCSGVGTWQRNPHARWTTMPSDAIELSAVQSKLLANVAPGVKPGGKLIYSVCTLTYVETSAVVDRFNETHPWFEPVILPLEKIGMERGRVMPEAACLTLGPESFGGNGMFVAAWRRGK